MKELIAKLRAIVGDLYVLTDDLQVYEADWRQRARGRALCVVKPKTTEEVASIVRLCAEMCASGEKISIVPQGGNTGLVLGSIPDETGEQIVLSLQRMNQIRDIDLVNLSITVEAGCILQNVQQAARDAGLLFPLSLAAEGSCTLGGNLATNAGGNQVVRYGNTRDLCLGLEAVTAQGDIWHGLTGLRKDNTGYDLRNLLIGSEGTLGIITAATMKLVPMPKAKLTAWVQLEGLEQAQNLLILARRELADQLTCFEIMSQFAVSLVAKHFPRTTIPLFDAFTQANTSFYFVLLEVSDYESEARARQLLEALMELAFDQDIVVDAVVAESIAQSQALWHVRESIPLAQAQEGPNIKHDVSVPISRVAQFCNTTDAQLLAALPGIRLVNFGHLGDGNLHYNLQCPEGVDAKQFILAHEAQINAMVYDNVTKYGGSISAEHGIGRLKSGELTRYKSKTALRMMRSVKEAMDPLGILNPSCLLHPAESALLF